MLAAVLVLPSLAAFAACASARGAASGHDGGTASTPVSDPAGNTAPTSACEAARGPGMTVIRAFATTVGGVRQWEAQQTAMDAERAGEPSSSVGQATWSDARSAGTGAVLCYLDGAVAKAPPPTPGGPDPAPFDRVVVAVLDDGSVTAVVLGYRENIPVHAPHGR